MKLPLRRDARHGEKAGAPACLFGTSPSFDYLSLFCDVTSQTI